MSLPPSTATVAFILRILTLAIQNHPITDFPSFFVHPCNTADAMRELLSDRHVSAVEYLMIWLGLVGSCVGLHLPKELALAVESAIR